MTENQIKIIIERNQVLPDELDKDKFFGFFPAICLTLAFGMPLLPFIIDKTSINPIIKWIGFISGLILILITYFSFKNEKKLKSIRTNFDRESNLKFVEQFVNNERIIEKYFKKQNILFSKYSNYYSTFLPTLFYRKGLKLIIIPCKNKIIFNLRTIGFGFLKGRIPYSIGKIIQQNKLTKNLKKLSTTMN